MWKPKNFVSKHELQPGADARQLIYYNGSGSTVLLDLYVSGAGGGAIETQNREGHETYNSNQIFGDSWFASQRVGNDLKLGIKAPKGTAAASPENGGKKAPTLTVWILAHRTVE